MKKTLLTLFMAVAAFTNGWGQDYPQGYLADGVDPAKLDFIKAPEPITSGAFAYDFYYYHWGLEQRKEEGVSDKALYDEATELYLVFGQQETIGITLTPETTPEIILLCERAVTDVQLANSIVKNKYQRRRPFATFNEPSLKPEDDEKEALTYSYPSGHSTRGYMYALTLCALIPSQTPQIMLRAQEYALNRVICGHHWKSDTDAALLLASAMFANVVCTDEFQAQLAKARKEYQQVATNVAAARSETAQSAAIYDLQGRKVTSVLHPGVYIQQGRKIVNQ